jgi:hypothetical protein
MIQHAGDMLSCAVAIKRPLLLLCSSYQRVTPVHTSFCAPVCVLQIDGETHVLHTEEAPQGTRLVVDTLSCLIAKEADPSRIMAQVR